MVSMAHSDPVLPGRNFAEVVSPIILGTDLPKYIFSNR